MYTTHGLMTAADLADHHALYDTGANPKCPGHDSADNSYLVYCSVNEECPDKNGYCDFCGGPLASDGVCADDNCGE
jgi:hypothetical protein